MSKTITIVVNEGTRPEDLEGFLQNCRNGYASGLLVGEVSVTDNADTETTTVVEYGIRKWALDNPAIWSLMGWFDDREVAEQVLTEVQGYSEGWGAVLVERTTVKTTTIKEA